MSDSSASLLVVCDHDRGSLADAALEALTAGRALAADLGVAMHASLLGGAAEALADEVAAHGADVVHLGEHDLLSDYGPETWGAAVADLIDAERPVAVLSVGSDRGNEIMAQVAARLDLPFAANCLTVSPGDPWAVTRVQWGGSLLEDSSLTSPTPLLTMALHAVQSTPADSARAGTIARFRPDLDPALARTMVIDRVVLTSGVTLPTAAVVVGGGRGVGSVEGFESLEDLAELLGGVVGCSRAVTNNGWRPHRDQVGQTGTRIAPEIYIAAGISGAIQHWVGASASKKILAINTDQGANMVTRADYAVIADLHEVIPAIAAEIRSRRAG